MNRSFDADLPVMTRRIGRVGHVVMNRPQALNALDLQMIRLLSGALAEFRDDPAVHAVVIEGAGGKAFCAGGDIRAVRAWALAGDEAAIEAFFSEEYALNAAIAAYPKPVVSLIDGYCMGGGIGVSVHGTIRVATEAAQFAMPETAIALFPDVGTSYVLPRLPGQLGIYLGLTGHRLAGGDAVHAGFATHFVRREKLAGLREAVCERGVAVIAQAAEPPLPFSLAAHQAAIDRCFGHDSMAAIIAALQAEGSAWAEETLSTLARMSPSSLRWTLALLRAGAGRDLSQCLAAELALVRQVTRHPDFAEGVRAMLVDKDRTPRWVAVSDPV